MDNLDVIALPAFVVARDRDGVFRYAGLNLAAERWIGVRRQDLLGRTPSEVLGASTGERLLSFYRECLAERTVVEYEASADLPAGSARWRTLLVPTLAADGTPAALLGLCSPARAGTRAETDLLVINQHLQLAIRSLKGADWRYDVERDRYDASPNLALLMGEEQPRPVGWDEWVARIFPEDLVSCSCAAVISGAEREQVVRFRFRGRGGETRWASCRRVLAASATSPVVCGVVTDVSEEVAREQQLREEARRDSLTRLLNRRGFRQRCEELDAANHPAAGLALFMMDLDEFKRINDRLGHAVGDAVLVEAARRLGSLFGPEAAVARLGGDEFVAMVGGLTEHEASRMAETVEAALSRPLARPDGAVPMAGSVGLCWRAEARDVHGMMAEADDRLYRVKRARKRQHAPDEADLQISLFAA